MYVLNIRPAGVANKNKLDILPAAKGFLVSFGRQIKTATITIF